MSRFQNLSADDVDDFDFPLEPGASNVSGSSTGMASSMPMNNMSDMSGLLAGMMGSGLGVNPSSKQEVDRSRWKNWETIYPRYLDSKAPHKAGGRRVSLEYSLRWPLAHLIKSACSNLGFPCQLEDDKTHPTDWQNPGRVKVLLKRNGKPINRSIPNKYSLLCKLGELLRPLESTRLKLPPPTRQNLKSRPLPHITLRLPYNSPAISHGFLAMAEAEAQQASSSSTSAGGVATIKDKSSIATNEQQKNAKTIPKKKKKSKK
ncbi:hypothetical protein O181_068180 [Austropuccinia psidii MF-1]|uniref:Signal recognition particle subunit SRP19 n=1 Tax=Austropuccinia psidii MF-1 TaxID=1389203 RepID=A0A9Q3ES35_9BASI|nr:hypothetical protein [Austropuccinia psidii MF-1]